jgi:hypothetical protein
MKWQKMGLIYCPDGKYSWAQHSALTPTPFLIREKVIRIFAGFRDNNGVSRIGYVDVDAENPSKVLSVSESPILDVGVPGAFDDNGLILGDVIRVGDAIYLYYIGFQLVEKVKFLAFTGLAISHDGGESFKRFSEAPILDRNQEGLFFRAIHSITFKDGVYTAWLGAGRQWSQIEGRSYPSYSIRRVESRDGIHFENDRAVNILFADSEYRIGRPRVFDNGAGYSMFYTKGTLTKDYLPGYATSLDSENWVRKDSEVGIGLSNTGWDSLHLSYPTAFKYKEKTYLFYNGNNMGSTGFGWALMKD